MSRTAAAVRIGPPRRIVVDLRSALAVSGTMLKYLSPAVLVPAVVAVGYREPVAPFLWAGLVGLLVGYGFERLRAGRPSIGYREGYLVVALVWTLTMVFGALPYLFSGDPQLDRPVDALFESMSGFTTTGASVVTDIDELDRSLLLWRQLTHWIGGIGIVVMALAVLPRLRVGGRQILENEMPGPEVDQLGVRVKETVRRLWLVYVALTLAEVALLAGFGWTGVDPRMTLYRAVGNSFATISTGGFSTENTSMADFAPASQWVVAVFMILSGMNLALIWAALWGRRPRALLRDEEARWYLVILTMATVLLVLEILRTGEAGRDAPLRHAVFQAATIMTTTGFGTVDFATWGALGSMTLVMLMLIGGSAGSTAGSVKVVRHLLLGKVLRRELQVALHPELVRPVTLNRRTVDERTLRAVVGFVVLYVGFLLAGAVVVAADAASGGPAVTPLDAVAISAATLGNVGATLGPAGPLSNYEAFGDVSTATMTVLMGLGRIELIPVVVLLTRRFWRP